MSRCLIKYCQSHIRRRMMASPESHRATKQGVGTQPPKGNDQRGPGVSAATAGFVFQPPLVDFHLILTLGRCKSKCVAFSWGIPPCCAVRGYFCPPPFSQSLQESSWVQDGSDQSPIETISPIGPKGINSRWSCVVGVGEEPVEATVGEEVGVDRYQGHDAPTIRHSRGLSNVHLVI